MILLLRTTSMAIVAQVVYVAALAPTTLGIVIATIVATGPKAIYLKLICQGCLGQVILPLIGVGPYKCNINVQFL